MPSDAAHHFAQLTWACIVQAAQFPTFQAIYISLQIMLDGSNCHIFPLCFIQLKQKIDRSSGHRRKRTLHFFYIFPSYIQYIYWLGAEKIEPDFLMCAYAAYSIAIFPGKYVHTYNRVTRRKLLWQLYWLITAQIALGHILSRVDVKAAQLGSNGVTWL